MDLGLTATLLGQGMKGIGQIVSGYESKLANDFNAAVSRANAQALRDSAQSVGLAGEFDIRRMAKNKKRLSSAQVAGYSKAGVKLAGSPIEVMIDSAAESEIDQLISKYNTNTQQIGLNLQAKQSEIEAQRYKLSGKSSVRQGYLGAFSTLLSTAGSFYTGKK